MAYYMRLLFLRVNVLAGLDINVNVPLSVLVMLLTSKGIKIPSAPFFVFKKACLKAAKLMFPEMLLIILMLKLMFVYVLL